jgi:hypothetical protein
MPWSSGWSLSADSNSATAAVTIPLAAYTRPRCHVREVPRFIARHLLGPLELRNRAVEVAFGVQVGTYAYAVLFNISEASGIAAEPSFGGGSTEHNIKDLIPLRCPTH